MNRSLRMRDYLKLKDGLCGVLPVADDNRPFHSALLEHEPQVGLLQKEEGEAGPHEPRLGA